MKSSLIIGSRGSKLALYQANFVKENLLKLFPSLNVEILEIQTKGDKVLDVSLNKVGGKGLFTKEIEDALLEQKIDLAVHSLKDLPTILPDGLSLGAVLNREEPHDVLIAKQGLRQGPTTLFQSLKSKSVVGTSSLRRIAQLKNLRDDLSYEDLRGNVDTRIKKLKDGKYDAIVLAYAGIKRLGIIESEKDLDFEMLDPKSILPAVGQGALGIEIREEDSETRDIIGKLNDINAYLSTLAERNFLEKMKGGCNTPIGAYSEIKNGMLTLYGTVLSLDGKNKVGGSETMPLSGAVFAGVKLAEKIINNGGGQILISILDDLGELSIEGN